MRRAGSVGRRISASGPSRHFAVMRILVAIWP